MLLLIQSVRLSVCLSVTRLDQSRTVKVTIIQFSLHSSSIPLVFAEINFIQKFQRVPPERERQTTMGLREYHNI